MLFVRLRRKPGLVSHRKVDMFRQDLLKIQEVPRQSSCEVSHRLVETRHPRGLQGSVVILIVAAMDGPCYTDLV